MPAIARAKLNNPALLRWARETAGYDIDSMARHMQKSPGDIVAWEAGDAAPTLRQLQKLARRVHRPVAALYLPDVPAEPSLPPDFRMLPGADREAYGPEALLAFRALRNNLGQLRELHSELGETIALSLPEWPGMDRPAEERAAEIRTAIGVPFEQQLAWREKYQAFREWRSALYDRGIIAQTFPMAVADVRAFSMIEHGLAGIGVSSKDAVFGRIFSMFHEVAHICLRLPGVSGFVSREQSDADVGRLEVYCDRFAAACLLPAGEPEVQKALDYIGEDLTLARADSMADRLKVSKYVLMRRARDEGLVDVGEYWGCIDEWRRQDVGRGGPGGGGNYYTNKVSGLGRGFVTKVFQAMDRGAITERDAARVLDVRIGGLDGVREIVASG